MSASQTLSSPPRHRRKPYLSIFFATACGLGYIPIAPGTFGSLLGLLLALVPFQIWAAIGGAGLVQSFVIHHVPTDPLLVAQAFGGLVIALVGVWVAGRAARYWQAEDPQRVVVDEVSGQHLALVLGSILPIWWRTPASWVPPRMGFITYQSVPNWKYLLLGFILFRAFDIWKPFPVRQAESLSGGWGIMADDWLAGIYAALVLWLARAAGL